mgnify:CR=1 FL=1
MRLSVLMTVYNEADFIDYAIRSCIEHVDDLIIVEGAYQETIKLGKSERSSDGTLQIIESYKNHPKVKIIYANEYSDKDQRNVGLAEIKKINPDGWLLIVDGDECWQPIALQTVKKDIIVFEKSGIKACYYISMTFVNDFNHYTYQKFPRLFKITPECLFTDDNFMYWKEATWSAPYICSSDKKYFHYSFLKSKERFETKKQWWETRFGREFDYGWRINDSGLIEDKNHKIFEFTGKHPDVIKDHPLWKENKK